MTTREVVAAIEKRLKPNKEFHYFRDEAEFMHAAAKTPRSNCVMDNSKLLATGIMMSDVHEAIDKSLSNWMQDNSSKRSGRPERADAATAGVSMPIGGQR